MARKPSERRNYKEPDQELNLTPMMNLIAILIPALLISAAFIEIAVINVAAPAIGSAPDQPEPEKPDKEPLNLTVTITEAGYTLAGSGAVLGAENADGGPTIPVMERATSCNRYLGTVPPPRSKNKSFPACDDPAEERTFWVYDVEALNKKLDEIKEGFPDERRVIIAAEPGVEFEALTDVMDASREIRDASGEKKVLFDEVVLSPGLS